MRTVRSRTPGRPYGSGRSTIESMTCESLTLAALRRATPNPPPARAVTKPIPETLLCNVSGRGPTTGRRSLLGSDFGPQLFRLLWPTRIFGGHNQRRGRYASAPTSVKYHTALPKIPPRCLASTPETLPPVGCSERQTTHHGPRLSGEAHGDRQVLRAAARQLPRPPAPPVVPGWATPPRRTRQSALLARLEAQHPQPSPQAPSPRLDGPSRRRRSSRPTWARFASSSVGSRLASTPSAPASSPSSRRASSAATTRPSHPVFFVCCDVA